MTDNLEHVRVALRNLEIYIGNHPEAIKYYERKKQELESLLAPKDESLCVTKLPSPKKNVKKHLKK